MDRQYLTLWIIPVNADPRCHVEPNRPILEPTPSPTPLSPPGDMREYDATVPPTSRPLCPGMVAGFEIVNLDDVDATPFAIEDGMTVPLGQLPKVFSVQAILSDGDDTATQVKFFVNGNHVHTDSTAPFAFAGAHEFSQLYVPGIYTLSAIAMSADGTWEPTNDECAVSVTVEYANPPGVCEGIVTKFALFNTHTQTIVPGYESLADGQGLELSSLPDHLSIVAFTNGREGDKLTFYMDDTELVSVTEPPYAITGNGVGSVPEWTLLRETGSYTIKAQMENRLGIMEDTFCQITIHVDSDWICDYDIQGFSLINAETNEVVPGYEHMAGNRVIDLADVPSFLSLRANKISENVNPNKGVQFFLNGDRLRTEGAEPFAINGDRAGDYNAYGILTTPGVYHIEARGKQNGVWESLGQRCSLSLSVIDSSYEVGGSIPPETIIRLIDNDDGPCAPKLVTPITVGNHMYYSTPVKVVDVRTDDTVAFKVFNYILDSSMDWITTSFVTASGVEVCDKVENVAFEDFTEHVYEAKCHNGFAYADVFAYSSTFSTEQASADTTLLPEGCKNSFEGQVVRYTFVFSCNCEETPEIPPEIIGGIPIESRTCAGNIGNSWGDPHVVPYDGGQWGMFTVRWTPRLVNIFRTVLTRFVTLRLPRNRRVCSFEGNFERLSLRLRR